ncbi:hypothetical protein DFH07DRAFT_415265 [Mycena maculata]|uniref:Secreted protein n=1 Tax=Mycena maculata TaxID=230809 RepID=A0AAD7JD98_9AGAR|nr:hypothetical protein DFH07DRAFT_415265 [Mycena maculata]
MAGSRHARALFLWLHYARMLMLMRNVLSALYRSLSSRCLSYRSNLLASCPASVHSLQHFIRLYIMIPRTHESPDRIKYIHYVIAIVHLH